MKKRNRIIIILLFVAWVVFLGFLREYLFVNINYNIEFLSGNRVYNYADSAFQFMSEYSISTLYTLKWVGTLLFFLLYWLSGILFIKILYNQKKFMLIYTIIYLAIFTFAGLAYAGGLIFSEPGEGYSLARKIMGWGQSPIPLMFLWGGIHLERRINL